MAITSSRLRGADVTIASFAEPASNFSRKHCRMELTAIKTLLDDLERRVRALRGYL